MIPTFFFVLSCLSLLIWLGFIRDLLDVAVQRLYKHRRLARICNVCVAKAMGVLEFIFASQHTDCKSARAEKTQNIASLRQPFYASLTTYYLSLFSTVTQFPFVRACSLGSYIA